MILHNPKRNREFIKSKNRETELGTDMSDMINGQRVIDSPKFRNKEFPKILRELVDSLSRPITISPKEIKLYGNCWKTQGTFKVYNKEEQPYYQINIIIKSESPALSLNAIDIQPEKKKIFHPSVSEKLS